MKNQVEGSKKEKVVGKKKTIQKCPIMPLSEHIN